MITEDQLEQQCLEWFRSIGYDYNCGHDIAPDGYQSECSVYNVLS
jgi:type I restriction enzyme, R subunit